MKKLSNKQLQIAENWVRYKTKPVHFFQECCYLPTPGGDSLITLNTPQKKIVKDFYGGIHEMIFLKSRQIGFSTLFQLICTHLLVFYSNAIIGVTSRDGAEASDFARKTKDIIQKMPKVYRPTFKWNNVQDFSIAETNSQFYCSAVSPPNPGALFRGKSIALLILDEAAHILKIEEGWTGVAPALSKAQKAAKENGIPFGTIILSTPNRCTGIGKFFFDMWTHAIEKTNSFEPYKVHWSEVAEYKNDPNWYKEQCKRLNNNQRRIQQELELQFVGDEDTLFPEYTIRALQDVTVDPTNQIRMPEGGKVWAFNNDIDKKRFYLIGVDVSSSYGNDYSGVEVVDYITMEQIYEYKGKCEPKKLASIVRMLSALCPNNLIIVENTGGYGTSVLNELQYDPIYSYNLFWEYRKTDPAKQRIPGLSTNTHTRPLIIQSLYETVTERPELIKSERLKLELYSLVNKANKVQADVDSNDDLTMAYAFCCYIRKYYADIVAIEEDIGINVPETTEALQDMAEMNEFDPLPPLYQDETNSNKKQFDDLKETVRERVVLNSKQLKKKNILDSIYGPDFVSKYFSN